MPNTHAARLKTDLAGVTLANPVIMAAGTAGVLDEYADVLDLARVGGLVTKSITPSPREGNPTWRIIECAAGMLNAIGLANPGLDGFLEHIAPRIPALPTRVFASVAGFRVEDYVKVAGCFDDIEALAGIELNVSCPNVHGGCEFGADTGALRELVAAVRRVVTRKPLFVKLSPIAVAPRGLSMADIARAAIDPAPNSSHAASGPNSRSGADGLCISNTIPAMAIDVNTRRPRLANVTGGLSGAALHPIAVKLVHDVYRAVAADARVPIVGIGGVLRWQDAAEFILAGATAVQLGTGLFADPRLPLKIARGLAGWVASQEADDIATLIGGVDLDPPPAN